jgi:hypothetical protein
VALENWNGTCEKSRHETQKPHVHHVLGLSHSVFEILCASCLASHHNKQRHQTRCKYYCYFDAYKTLSGLGC